MKMRDKKANKPGLPSRSFPHRRHREQPISKYPFLHSEGKRLEHFTNREINKDTSEKRTNEESPEGKKEVVVKVRG